MDDSGSTLSLSERHQVIMRMTELNSQLLRCDSERNGLDFELAGVEKEVGDREATAPEKTLIAELKKKLDCVQQKQEQYRSEIDGLEQELLGPDPKASTS